MINELPKEILSLEVSKYCGKTDLKNLILVNKEFKQIFKPKLEQYRPRKCLVYYDNPAFYDENRWLCYNNDAKMYMNMESREKVCFPSNYRDLAKKSAATGDVFSS